MLVPADSQASLPVFQGGQPTMSPEMIGRE